MNEKAVARDTGAVGIRRPWLTWSVVLAGLGIAYSPMWLPQLIQGFGALGVASSIVWNVIAAGGLVAYILRVERRPLASIGFRKPQTREIEWALYLFGGYMAWQWIVMTFLPPTADTGTERITSMPVVGVLALIVSAAVFEEILYRGYPIERLTELTRQRWLAFLLTVPLFVAPHVVFFGVPWLWNSGVGTIALYVLYAKTRNLPACMLLHLCVNLPILLPTIAGRLGG